MRFLSYSMEELFLYFIFYSFLGWVMETCYCSICERRPVSRGFLYGPICPIYGLGVLMMILFFTSLKDSPILFYVVAVVVMSSWEYFVAWLLETTTHIKYWDYSNFPFHIKGRICLWVALVWGMLSYAVIFWIHPPIETLYSRLPSRFADPLCWIFLAMLSVDAVFTIHHLALVSKLVVNITEVTQRLQLQLSLGRSKLEHQLENHMIQFERYSRRFRGHYAKMKVSAGYTVHMEDLRDAVALARNQLRKQKKTAREKLRPGRRRK